MDVSKKYICNRQSQKARNYRHEQDQLKYYRNTLRPGILTLIALVEVRRDDLILKVRRQVCLGLVVGDGKVDQDKAVQSPLWPSALHSH